MKQRCVLCGQSYDSLTMTPDSTGRAWVEGVMPVEVGYVDVGQQGGHTVIVLGLDLLPLGEKALISVDVDQFVPHYREIGRLMQFIVGARGN